ncbi:MAG: hypothetical protein ACJAYG_001809 [Oceanicoccus sp.]|jgi:hypothetical protein
MVDSVLSSGLQGIQAGIGQARQAAQDIADATVAPTSNDATGPASKDPVRAIAEAAVALRVSEQQVQASAAVVKTADEVLGTILDTKA